MTLGWNYNTGRRHLKDWMKTCVQTLTQEQKAMMQGTRDCVGLRDTSTRILSVPYLQLLLLLEYD